MSKLPKAILFDLDDTLVNTSDTISEAWRVVSRQYAKELGEVTYEELLSAVRMFVSPFRKVTKSSPVASGRLR